MKRFSGIILIFTLFQLIITPAASAAQFKDGSVYSSDTNAFIDGYPIPVYSYMGYPYLLARDLTGYCFDVEYDEALRSVKITQNTAKAMYPYSKAGNSLSTGKPIGRITKSDIRVYLKDNEIQAYNMNGNMLICMDELYRFGEVNWYEDSKTIAFTSSGFINANPLWESLMPKKYANYRKNPPRQTRDNYYPDSRVPALSALTSAELIKEQTAANGQRQYVYNFDEEAAVQYITLMCDYFGYEIADKKTDFFSAYTNYYLKKDKTVCIMSIRFDSNRIIIAIQQLD